ncbi:helix-turn-helix domain-containing protein [Deinococcus sonorensis]|uniref:FeoC-like transcriptional regulator n=2 Tax=Deinococcus sonorensis TaxID=309891 RepID=A0AAU7U8C0_9DEIO
MTRLATLLNALHREPRTLAELSAELGSSSAALEGMLQTLYAGGYIQDAAPQQDGCSCTGCSLKSLCRNAEADLPPLNLLRLTPRGEQYLRRQATHV